MIISEVLKLKIENKISLPFYNCLVPAGFPSPADDYIEDKLDLNNYLVKHPSATFFVRVVGESMIGAGIHNNDILIVDRSIEPRHNKIVVVALDGQMTVKRLYRRQKKTILMPENKLFKPIEVVDSASMLIWGVVTNVIHSL
tara:strand:- start:575 stop:1000 length:426 start_codon:yes stop_codon:yes gene_type:complete